MVSILSSVSHVFAILKNKVANKQNLPKSRMFQHTHYPASWGSRGKRVTESARPARATEQDTVSGTKKKATIKSFFKKISQHQVPLEETMRPTDLSHSK